MKRLVSRARAAPCLAAVVLVPGTLLAQAERAISDIAGDVYGLQNYFLLVSAGVAFSDLLLALVPFSFRTLRRLRDVQSPLLRYGLYVDPSVSHAELYCA